MGDLNANIGLKSATDNTKCVGPFGTGSRSKR